MPQLRLLELAGSGKVKPVIPPDLPISHAPGFLNILILGDGYTEAMRAKFYKDRIAIIKNLFETAPFDMRTTWINIFSKFSPSQNAYTTGGSTLFNSHFNSNNKLNLDPQALFDYVRALDYDGYYSGFITNGDVWLNNSSRSYGCVGIILPDNKWGGRYFKDVNVQGGKISFFIVSATADDRRFFLGRIFLHELGHSLGLGDEYEIQGTQTPGCSDHLYYDPLQLGPNDHRAWEYPNVVYRDEILLPSVSLRQEDSLNESDIDITKIPWLHKMTLNEKNQLKIRMHPFRKSYTDELTNSIYFSNPCAIDEEAYLDVPMEIGPGQNLEWTKDSVGLVEGALRYRRNIFRPSLNCLMRDDFSKQIEETPGGVLEKFPGFCSVCSEWIQKRILTPSNQLGPLLNYTRLSPI